jgi:hypothetical protein
MSQYSFLRWLRSGAAAALFDDEHGGRTQLRAGFEVGVVLTDLTAARTVTTKLALFGPGDVVGIDQRQVIRRVPEPGSASADVELFPHIEFDRPDLPWLFTPFSELAGERVVGVTGAGTLTPWLCLVVAPYEQATLSYSAGDLLPVLQCATTELPDLAEAHTWAHVQIMGELPSTKSDVIQLLDGHPERTLSRLVAPRLLAAHMRYVACVVPVFEAGRQAGLGETVKAGPTDLAWTGQQTGPVRLPVYHSWEFTSGAAGGFETLVRALRPATAVELEGVGRRSLDISHPNFGMTDHDPGERGMHVEVLGCLRTADSNPLRKLDAAFGDELAPILEQVDKVAPPLYGRWHAGERSIAQPTARRAWFERLNLDPGFRVIAGLGAEVVRANQETFMAAAWRQLGEVQRANQLLRQAELALAASQRVHRRHIQPLTPANLLGVTGPVLSRLRGVDGSSTIRFEITTTCLPITVTWGAFRRLLRRRGPLGRRLARDDAYRPLAVVNRLAAGDRLGPLPTHAPVAVLESDALAELVGNGFTVDWSQSDLPEPEPEAGRALAEGLAHFVDRGTPSCAPLPMVPLADRVKTALDPSTTIPHRARSQLEVPTGLWDPPDRIDPIMASPRIDTPMWTFVRDSGQDWLLPGLERVPRDRITGLVTNQAFAEAFLVGLNHEMGAELLWRGFPTDQRGTAFAYFWDRRVSGQAAKRGDIDEIHRWERSDLGSHMSRTPMPDQFVLLIRGELLTRFPRATIFLCRARWESTPGGTRTPEDITQTTTRLPIFSGHLVPDVTFLGFDIDGGTARGIGNDPGYYVVFQEQPTEPRFGVSETVGDQAPPPNVKRLNTWLDLGRPLLVTNNGYLDVEGSTASQAFKDAAGIGTTAPLLPRWLGRADTIASIFLKRPFRMYRHASDLLPP